MSLYPLWMGFWLNDKKNAVSSCVLFYCSYDAGIDGRLDKLTIIENGHNIKHNEGSNNVCSDNREVAKGYNRVNTNIISCFKV